MRISDYPSNEKPIEKLLSNGVSSLSDAELVAIIISNGTKNKNAVELAIGLLKDTEGLTELLSKELQYYIKTKGIGQKKACKLITCKEIANRIQNKNNNTNIKVKKPEDIYKIIRQDIYNKSKEILLLVCMDSRNMLISKDIISIGTVNEALLSTREIFSQALKRNAVSIAIAHNHPSQDRSPSDEDILTTKKVYEASIILEIKFVDHIIATNNDFFSFKLSGIIF